MKSISKITAVKLLIVLMLVLIAQSVSASSFVIKPQLAFDKDIYSIRELSSTCLVRLAKELKYFILLLSSPFSTKF